MPTQEQTLEEILDLAAKHFKVGREKLTPDDDFFKTLGIDSLQALDLLTRLENHFMSSCLTTNCREYRTSGRWLDEFRRACKNHHEAAEIDDGFCKSHRFPHCLQVIGLVNIAFLHSSTRPW